MPAWRKLGVIACAGALPIRITAACEQNGKDFFCIRLKGITGSALDAYPGIELGIGEAGKILSALRKAGCDAVVYAGIVKRPDFSSMRVDFHGAKLLPQIISAAARGDGHILDVLANTIEAEGFQLLGAHEVVSDLTAQAGAFGEHVPTEQHLHDIAKGAQLIAAMGPYDVGQGVVVSNGFVLGVEAAEGTDEMLSRCARLPNNVSKGGVLVKRPKPDQEVRIDLPTIGLETVKRASDAGFSGIAVEAGMCIVLEKDKVLQAANDLGLFVYGFEKREIE